MKKRTLLGLSAILALVALALVFPGAKVDAGTRTKSDRAAQLWKMSGLADKTGEPFNHWNTASPAVIPTTCAKCHNGIYEKFQADHLAVASVHVNHLPPPAAAATIACEPLAPSRHEILTEVKAVTYHQLQFRAEGGRWVGRVVLDL